MHVSEEDKLSQMPQSMYTGPQLRMPSGTGGSAGTSQLSSAYPSRSQQMHDQLSDSSSSEDKEEHSGQGGDGTNRQKGTSKRTPKQQLQNKQAQQRYRQRRKQKLAEMEQALELLNHKVQDMQQLQSQNYYLGGRLAKLEQGLKSKEAEITKLRQLISQQHMLSGGSRPGLSPNLVDPELMKKNFVDSVERLKEFVTLCNLRNADASGANVPEEVVVQCKSLVQAASAQCMEAMSPDNPAVLDIISRDPSRLSPRETHSDRRRWLQVVEALRLSEDQVEIILQVRREQLKKLKGIYSERLLLHGQAVEALLPSDALTRQLQHLHLNGFLYTVKDHVRVSASLEALKENLRAEITSLQDFSYMVTLNILSPIQAALLFVDAFPFHCDTLALANALAITRGEPQATSPLAASMPLPQSDIAMNEAAGGLLASGSSTLDPLALLGVATSPLAGHHRPPRLSLPIGQHSPTISAMDTTSPTGGIGALGPMLHPQPLGVLGPHRIVHSTQDRHLSLNPR